MRLICDGVSSSCSMHARACLFLCRLCPPQRRCAGAEADNSPLKKEQSIRALLNFGHTFGHAIETLSNYETSHGEAVACGIRMASYMSCRMGMITEDELNKIDMAMVYIGVSTTSFDSTIQGPQLLNAMRQDKKVKDGKIQLVLLRNIGEAFVTADYPQDLLESIVQNY